MKVIIGAILILVTLTAPLHAQLHVTTDRDGVPLGSVEILTPVASTAFTPPTGAEWALISVRSAGIHMSFNGSPATTSMIYLAPGLYRTAYVARGTITPTILLTDYRIINSTDGASTVYVAYFRRP